MRSILCALLVLVLSVVLTPAFADSHAKSEPGVIHMVVVWLKEPGNAEHRQRVIAGSKKLKQIPGVLDLRVGKVVPSDREVVDSSYDIALYLRFANKADLQAYLVHPIHKNTVKEEFVPVLDHYKVFDFTDE